MARILIIEDNPTNLDLMTYLLQTYGHTVLSAADGERGLDAARREQADLIVCDLQIPKLDGYEVARRLKIHPALRRIPLIAVTAFAMVGDRDKVMSAGFDGYISKPIDPQTFVGQVESFLEPSGDPGPSVSDTQGTRPSGRATILVVDNSLVNLSLAQGILEPFGYKLVIAHSAGEGLALARQVRPDLILSDLHMPGEDGFDFIKSVKADPRLKKIPFVFISSTIWLDADRVTCLELGANRFIERPIEPQALVDQIEASLKEGRTSDE